MDYRILGRTGLKVSEIGLGCEYLAKMDGSGILEILDAAVAAGVNYFDLFSPEPHVRDAFGQGMRGRREKFILQAHLCSAWIDGQYKRVREMDQVKAAFADLLNRLDTSYIDVGMIHFIDQQEDFDGVFHGPVIRFAQEQKAAGKIRHLGLSTHNPRMAAQAVRTGLIDVIMFSVNPAYDILPPSEDINTLFDKSSYESVLSRTDPERQELYSLCESQGVALTVMKPYGGGALLDEKASPFGAAMTAAQCLHYCLTRPGVASVMVGCDTPEHVEAACAYCTADEEARDYGRVLSAAPMHTYPTGQCTYCGHCAPCPAGIDIAMVNKLSDLAAAHEGDIPATIRAHYDALSAHAGDCIGCGGCESRCPFGVRVIEKMGHTLGLLGK